MSVAELQELEEVKGLITRGQQVGVLTYAEIATAIGRARPRRGRRRGAARPARALLKSSWSRRSTPPLAASLKIERAPEKRGRRKPKTALDLKPDRTTDALQLFLRDIGKVRLLSAQEEVDLAKRI